MEYYKVYNLVPDFSCPVRPKYHMKKNHCRPIFLVLPRYLLTLGIFVALQGCNKNTAGGPVGNGVAAGGARTTVTYPLPGNPSGACPVPAEAAAEDVSNPTTVVGTGTPESCTPAAFEAAVHNGGVITFNGGPDPVTITLDHEINVINDAGPNKLGDMVIDGGGKITLSGGGRCRILYQNGCDESLHWITSHCQNYEHPRMVVQNLIFANGYTNDPNDGGAALYVRSGILKVVNCVFVKNQCALVGPDVGGAAIYTIQQSGPVYIVSSTFGGDSAMGNIGSNGGALGSIGVSYTVLNCVMSWNKAVGSGMNPAQANTPGGGSGGAIYNDGDTYTLTICGSIIADNFANELAGAVFFVSNDLTGSLVIDQSTFYNNAGRDVQNLKGFFVLAKDTTITNTQIN